MKVTLKNFKHSEFMSQETDCFQATVYVDGVKVGVVSNEGHGGGNEVHLLPEFSHLNPFRKFDEPNPLMDGIEAAKSAIMRERAEKAATASVKRKLSKHLCYIKAGDKAGTYRVHKNLIGTPKEAPTRAFLAQRGDIILNDLPIEKAIPYLVVFE